MAEKNNKICIICKTPYHYCPNCKEGSGKPTWYNIFDSENCKNVYDVCCAYRDGVYDLKKANEELKKCDISLIDNYSPATKGFVEEILSYSEVKEIVKEASVETKNDIQKSFNKKK